MRPNIYIIALHDPLVGRVRTRNSTRELAHSLDPALIPEKVHDSWKDHPRSVSGTIYVVSLTQRVQIPNAWVLGA